LEVAIPRHRRDEDEGNKGNPDHFCVGKETRITLLVLIWGVSRGLFWHPNPISQVTAMGADGSTSTATAT
jgi:hypothetical protein